MNSSSSKQTFLTFLDQNQAETIGWPLHYAASQLGVWEGKEEDELYNLFDRWLDKSKFDLSVVWETPRRRYKKNHRIFKRGFTISEQIDDAIAIVEKSGRLEVDFREVLKHVQFHKKGNCDYWLTFYENLNPKHLSTDDKVYWRTYLEDIDNLMSLPVLPSSHTYVFKDGFDAEEKK